MPLLVRAPVGEPNAAGEYPVNYYGVAQSVGRDKRSRRAYLLSSPAAKMPKGYSSDSKGMLLSAFAPRLVHVLDAAFAGHVAEQLVARNVRDFALVYDCILVPADAYAELRDALVIAGREWFLGLEPIFALFDDVAPEMRQAWERRKAACEAGKDTWPRFRMKAETTLDYKTEDTSHAEDWAEEIAHEAERA